MVWNFGYVIPEKLAGCAHPGHGLTLRRELLALAENEKITAIVTLNQEALSEETLRKARMRYFHLPVRDFDVPAKEGLWDAIEFIREEIAAGGRVVAHCTAGCGRTGTLLACALALFENRDPAGAVAYLRGLRPGSVETPAQEEFVREWVEWARERERKTQ